MKTTTIKFQIWCFYFSLILVLNYGIESPQFTVVHTESDFEIRLYRESAWMSAAVRDISFEKATKVGFHRLYQYIRGANTNSSKLVMTAPVLTSITPEAHALVYYVRFFVSTFFNGSPPSPLPELNLQLGKWRTQCVAVRKFSGFAMSDTVSKEAEALVTSISRLVTGYTSLLQEKSLYTVAQYNASFHNVGRLNEVWINVTGLAKGRCQL